MFETLDVGRGAAFGDLDNDGDTDVVVGNNSGAPQVLVNTVDGRHHWIGLRLVARDAAAPGGRARDVLGARVAVDARRPADAVAPCARRWQLRLGERSARARRAGRVGAAPRVRVEWPDGRAEEWAGLPIDRYTTLVKGTGR